MAGAEDRLPGRRMTGVANQERVSKKGKRMEALTWGGRRMARGERILRSQGQKGKEPAIHGKREQRE